MYCIKKITDDLTWVGANDRRLAMFEGVYSVPYGVSYNSYLLRDEKNVLFDTVDKAVTQRFVENVKKVLDGGKLDYLIVQHMEPDHSASISAILNMYPDMKVVCTRQTADMIKNFYDLNIDSRAHIVKEKDTLSTGKHTLHFVSAPMVHWPEVMVTYDSADKILFSADAFGCFGALNGTLFADEVDFDRDYMDEARRYYANIVGKYGAQVQSLLNKAQTLEINMVCPLHGFVWRKDIGKIVSKYDLWSSYKPEEEGVMIAYASVYGNTEIAAEILASCLRDAGVKTEMFDVSVTPASEIVSAAFKWSHLVFASTTYNAGIFVAMEALLHDLTAHNIQNRSVAIIENGSWAPASGNLIAEKLSKCKNINILGEKITVKSSLKHSQLEEINKLAEIIASGIKKSDTPVNSNANSNAMFKLPYGLFILTAKDGDKNNGCVINTAMQITAMPVKICVTVNKSNFTHDIIAKTGEFNISVLSESAPFAVFERFGFKSGKDTDKFADAAYGMCAANGIRYIHDHANAVISAKVISSHDYGTHTMFIAGVTETAVLSGKSSMTYQYYLNNVKPKPQAPKADKKGFVCKICGYVYEGDNLPQDFICPLCKHGVQDFQQIA
ncbi:MAG: flavin reductase [Chitinispirillia bacterium]|nr:flavin reductase [Chitinispirillia bacterium]